MLAALLLLGLFDVDTTPAQPGVIVATPEQTVTAPKVPTPVASGAAIPLGAVQWAQPLDPSDRSPRAIDFSAALPTGSKIASIERLTISAAGFVAGVQIDQVGDRRPIISEDGTKVQLWFLVDPGDQALEAFSGAGLQVGIAALIRTDATPYQEYERTAVLTVRQL